MEDERRITKNSVGSKEISMSAIIGTTLKIDSKEESYDGKRREEV